MLKLQLGSIDLSILPPREAVVSSGGGRAISEKVALTGDVVALRPAKNGARRLKIIAPQGYAISSTDADALAALASSGAAFTLTLEGYELSGTFAGCVFEGDARFPVLGVPAWRGYDMNLYLPQVGA